MGPFTLLHRLPNRVIIINCDLGRIVTDMRKFRLLDSSCKLFLISLSIGAMACFVMGGERATDGFFDQGLVFFVCDVGEVVIEG
jgi:hypothetical protein